MTANVESRYSRDATKLKAQPQDNLAVLSISIDFCTSFRDAMMIAPTIPKTTERRNKYLCKLKYSYNLPKIFVVKQGHSSLSTVDLIVYRRQS